MQGEGAQTGVDLYCTTNVTVKNLQIKDYENCITLQFQIVVNEQHQTSYLASQQNTISECTIAGNFQNGVQLQCSFNNTIAHNTITCTGSKTRHAYPGTFGVYADTSSYNNITQNNITGCRTAIELNEWHSPDNGIGDEMSGNIIQGNFNGILVEGGGTANTIYKNTLTDNSGWAIQLSDCTNTALFENQISNNGFGIFLSSATNNAITENNIINNTGWAMQLNGSQTQNLIYRNNLINNNARMGFQVSIPWYFNVEGNDHHFVSTPGKANSWNNSAQGNFWSDYQTRYTNTSEVGMSGLGDTPFVINDNNVDQHPFMQPIATFNELNTQDVLSQVGVSSTNVPLQAESMVEYALAIVAAAVTAIIVTFWVRSKCNRKE
jgi:parallel beta-helix repeat protein